MTGIEPVHHRLVVTWRSRPTHTSSPVREAFVAIVDEPDEATRFECVEERHLVLVPSVAHG